MQETIVTISGAQAYIVTPAEYDGSSAFPVLMAIHGSGREALSYKEYNASTNPAGVDFYVAQRDYAINNGYIFCVISNGMDCWGTDQGLARINDLYDYVRSNYNTNAKFTLWATSAGGLLMHREIKDYPERVAKALGTFPVYDLEDMVARNSGAQSVWGGQSLEYRAARDPSQWPEALIGVRYLIYHGVDDSVVPLNIHSQTLQTDVNAISGSVELHSVSGGHSTTNWAVYDDTRMNLFLAPFEVFYDTTLATLVTTTYDTTLYSGALITNTSKILLGCNL